MTATAFAQNRTSRSGQAAVQAGSQPRFPRANQLCLGRWALLSAAGTQPRGTAGEGLRVTARGGGRGTRAQNQIPHPARFLESIRVRPSMCVEIRGPTLGPRLFSTVTKFQFSREMALWLLLCAGGVEKFLSLLGRGDSARCLAHTLSPGSLGVRPGSVCWGSGGLLSSPWCKSLC